MITYNIVLERGSLLAGDETGQAEFLACLLGGSDPLAQGPVLEVFLRHRELLFRDDLSGLVQAQVLLGELTVGHVCRSAPYSSHGPVLDSGLTGLAGHSPGLLG